MLFNRGYKVWSFKWFPMEICLRFKTFLVRWFLSDARWWTRDKQNFLSSPHHFASFASLFDDDEILLSSISMASESCYLRANWQYSRLRNVNVILFCARRLLTYDVLYLKEKKNPRAWRPESSMPLYDQIYLNFTLHTRLPSTLLT